jgi:hypothetical protein
MIRVIQPRQLRLGFHNLRHPPTHSKCLVASERISSGEAPPESLPPGIIAQSRARSQPPADLILSLAGSLQSPVLEPPQTAEPTSGPPCRT